jgi:hypothetical protein
MNIYESRIADHLTDPDYFTPAIRIYQQGERELLFQLAKPFNTLIEAGCSKGRYTAAVTETKRNYIGIDIAAHHIDDASTAHKSNSKALFFCDDILNFEKIFLANTINTNSSLLFFPFNCFGNLVNPVTILEKMAVLKISFAIFTYSPDANATCERSKYYHTSGFKDLSLTNESEGIRFTCATGLNTIAYHESWFKEAFSHLKIQYRRREFGEIGRAYSNF